MTTYPGSFGEMRCKITIFFCCGKIFCVILWSTMKLINKIKNSGPIIVVVGVVLLCVAYATGLTRHNWVMVLSLAIEAVGCVLCYRAMKG